MSTKKPTKNPRKNDKMRKKGETLRIVLCLIRLDPVLPVRVMARWVGFGEESIRAALRRIREKPERISALMGVSPEEIAWVLEARDKIALEMKSFRKVAREAEKAEKRKERKFRRLNAEYRQEASPVLKKKGQMFPKGVPKKPYFHGNKPLFQRKDV